MLSERYSENSGYEDSNRYQSLQGSMSDFPLASKQQQQRSLAFVMTALQEQARYEIRTVKRTIAIVHRAIRENDEESNQKRMATLIGELTALLHYIEAEVERNVTESFDTSEFEVENHTPVV